MVEGDAFTDSSALETVWIPSCLEALAAAVFEEWEEMDVMIIETGSRLSIADPTRNVEEPEFSFRQCHCHSNQGAREVPQLSAVGNAVALDEDGG
jgi:hypothetical protein